MIEQLSLTQIRNNDETLALLKYGMNVRKSPCSVHHIKTDNDTSSCRKTQISFAGQKDSA